MHREDLRRYLSEATGRPVRLKINDNLHAIVTAGPDGRGPGIRASVHRMFLDADAKILKCLAQFITHPTAHSRRVVREYINENRNKIQANYRTPLKRTRGGSAAGRVFDLAERAAHLNERHFQGAMKFRIEWMRLRPPSRSSKVQRHITLGNWNERLKVIRIHPILDDERVPLYYLDFIVYHEMVHIAVPSQVGSHGKMVHHGPDFYALERAYPLYREASAWQDKHLDNLVAAWNGIEKPVSENVQLTLF